MAIHQIQAAELKSILEEGRGVLIDVREPFEYKSEKIQGALNIPLSFLTKDSLKPFDGRTIILQCQSGNRSKQACQKISEFVASSDLKELEGGIVGWKKAGFAVRTAKDGRIVLPITQQVQLAIGLFLLLGTGFTYFISPAFLIVPLLIGLGLSNAGLTGWCGLARLIAVMPWNR